MDFELKSSFKTSPNIAVIKYWGKLNEKYIIPLNTSLGFTLNTDDLCTETSVILSTKNTQDKLILNGKDFAINKRLENILSRVRQNHLPQLIDSLVQKNPDLKQHLNTENFKFFSITSVNNFPTASGLASSASGLAAISVCLCDIFQIPEKLSEMARLGSGSACRSVYGGLVQWQGPSQSEIQYFYDNLNKSDNNEQIFNTEQLENLSVQSKSESILQEKKTEFFDKIKILIFCANFSAKEVPSTGGMKQSVETSSYLQYRVSETVNKNIESILKAIQNNDYNQFAQITIKDSNQFHSVCSDTNPPIFYLNEFSKLIIAIVHKLNDIFAKNSLPQVAYTYDAGPHAVLFIHENSFDIVYKVMEQIFQFNKDQLNGKGQQTMEKMEQNKFYVQEVYQKEIVEYFSQKVDGKPSYVIQTDVGNGPQKQE